MTSRKLAELMVGSELPSPSTEESTVTDRVLLAVRDIDARRRGRPPELADISFDIHAGEVLGIAGVEGNGQTELVETLVGHAAPAGGHGPDGRRRHQPLVHPAAPRGRASATSPRTASATACCSTRRCGRTASSATRPGPRRSRASGSTASGARADSERIVEQYDVRTPGIDTTARALSGGNQQKFIVGREMSGDPVLLIASHPTRGVDVGAQAADLGPHQAGPPLAVSPCC